MSVYSKWKWEEAYQYLRIYEDVIEIFDKYANMVELVVYTDLPTCIARVRSEQPTEFVLDDLILTYPDREIFKYDSKRAIADIEYLEEINYLHLPHCVHN